MSVQLQPANATTASLTEVCSLKALSPERGAAALVGGVQVALFRTHDDAVYAVQQRDPYSGANVVSRGIVGSRGDVPTVASPMYKQVFDLRTGACLDSVGRDPRRLVTYVVVVRDGVVLVGGPMEPAGAGQPEGAG
jgi:nitrite reductase (NADH) small subunit